MLGHNQSFSPQQLHDYHMTNDKIITWKITCLSLDKQKPRNITSFNGLCGKSLDIWLINNFQFSLIENESVIVSTFRNREYISITENFFQETETEKEDIKKQFHQF